MDDKQEIGMLTSAEAEVMNVVWDQDLVTVADVVERLPRELAYTTVMTTMNILEDKGWVSKRGKRGRAYLYGAEQPKDKAQGQMSHEIARRLFGGSVKSLVMNLVRDDAISADDLADVKRMIESLEDGK